MYTLFIRLGLHEASQVFKNQQQQTVHLPAAREQTQALSVWDIQGQGLGQGQYPGPVFDYWALLNRFM